MRGKKRGNPGECGNIRKPSSKVRVRKKEDFNWENLSKKRKGVPLTGCGGREAAGRAAKRRSLARACGEPVTDRR